MLASAGVFTKACTYQVRALAAVGGNVDQLVVPGKEVLDECVKREMRQQKEPLGCVEFDAWLRGDCAC